MFEVFHIQTSFLLELDYGFVPAPQTILFCSDSFADEKVARRRQRDQYQGDDDTGENKFQHNCMEGRGSDTDYRYGTNKCNRHMQAQRTSRETKPIVTAVSVKL